MLVKSWNNHAIRWREDGYGCLTDMAKATNVSIVEFLKHQRTLLYKVAYYENQTNSKITHPIIIDEKDDVWGTVGLVLEFCYFCPDKNFDVCVSKSICQLIEHPEIIKPLFDDFADKMTNKKQLNQKLKNEQIGSTTGFVYFMYNKTKNTVKIGYSKNPEARLKAFQCGTTDILDIIHTECGDKNQEKMLHERFKVHQIEREIFNYHKDIKDYINQK